MVPRALTLLVAAALIDSSLVGCRENVYLGNLVAHGDASAVVAPTEAGGETAVPPDAPPPPVRGYLHAQGEQIFDEAGSVVRFKGVNWPGMETGVRVPDGLHIRT